MKIILILSILALAVAALAQSLTLNGTSIRVLERSHSPNGAQTTAINNLWTALDLQKTNTVLIYIHITKDGTNIVLTVGESVRVKLVEN